MAQTAAAPNGQAALPTMAGSNLGATKPAPGIIAWSIKGNYLPMAEFIPPDPAKVAAANKPGAPNQPNPAPSNQPPPQIAPKTNP